MEGIEWREKMKEQNGEKTEWRKNSGRNRMEGGSRMEGKNEGAKFIEDIMEEE